MNKRKTFNITSLATSEKKDFTRLSLQAQKGWLLNDIKIPYLSYELVETNGVERDYLVDFNDDVNESYLENYKKRGWNYVCSNGSLHYFYSHKNNPPFYTHQEKKLELYTSKSKQFLLVFLVLALTNIATAFGFSYVNNQPNGIRAVVLVLFAATLLLIVTNVFFLYASFTYFGKAKNLRKDMHETTN